MVEIVGQGVPIGFTVIGDKVDFMRFVEGFVPTGAASPVSELGAPELVLRSAVSDDATHNGAVNDLIPNPTHNRHLPDQACLDEDIQSSTHFHQSDHQHPARQRLTCLQTLPLPCAKVYRTERRLQVQAPCE